MSSSLEASQIDFSEAFSDTSVLFNYTFDQDDGEAEELLCDHDCDDIVSSSLRDEYKNVRDRRKSIVKSMLKAQGRGEFDDWEPPSHINSGGHDLDYMISLMEELHSLDSNKLRKRLKIEERRITRGWETLFESPDEYIDLVWQCDRDPTILANIRSTVNHENDSQILCEAVDWAGNGGSGTVVAADHDDMISNREEISDTLDSISGASDLTLLTTDKFLSLDDSS